jgi:hypothetical protein
MWTAFGRFLVWHYFLLYEGTPETVPLPGNSKLVALSLYISGKT